MPFPWASTGQANSSQFLNMTTLWFLITFTLIILLAYAVSAQTLQCADGASPDFGFYPDIVACDNNIPTISNAYFQNSALDVVPLSGTPFATYSQVCAFICL